MFSIHERVRHLYVDMYVCLLDIDGLISPTRSVCTGVLGCLSDRTLFARQLQVIVAFVKSCKDEEREDVCFYGYIYTSKKIQQSITV